MAENGNREKDLRKVILFGLVQAGTEEELAKAIKAVFGPAVGGDDKVVGTTIRKDRADKPYAFVEFVDEASAAMALGLSGKKFPELGDAELKVEYANKPQPRAEPPKKGDPGAKGEKGDPGAKGEKGDPGAKGDKGDPGTPGAKGEKGDPGKAGPPGVPGKDGANGKDGDPAPKAAWILTLLVAIAALVVVLGHAFCGSAAGEDQTARSAAAAAQQKAESAQTAAYNASQAATSAVQAAATAAETAQQAASDIAKTLPDQITAAVNAAFEQAGERQPVTPAPEPAAPAPPATTAAPDQMVGVVVVQDRFRQIEVRLDRFEAAAQEVRKHLCAGSGPHDPTRCAATQ
jgi:hypothetical protein